jgi:hypothetical protein
VTPIDKPAGSRLGAWFLRDLAGPHDKTAKPTHTSPWWQVMCLTGVDYFSTLGYQPSIAFLAAGYLSPFATLVLVLLTLFGALPMYNRIAALSPNGQGSLSVLEERLPRWRGKTIVLVLLGFAATSFIITITLSAADATAHIIENPFVPQAFNHPIAVTMVLVVALGAVFLRGFGEAIWLAVILVAVYLALNVLVIGHEMIVLWRHPTAAGDWGTHLFEQQPNPWMMLVLAFALFPKLALGLSGFETGVAVMPLVAGSGETTGAQMLSRVANTRKLLRAAALIMSVLLIGSALVTTTLIPADEMKRGGLASGRALAYLAHRDLGDWVGTAYDISTIGILWFAGASAMAGLLNLVPRYLPRYGMAPDWARATRPLVLVFTVVGMVVTWFFNADVEKQGGAYATGVLMLMTSAAVAVMIAQPLSRAKFLPITLIFTYTTLANIYERPEGIKIATWFIVAIIASSLISRVMRSMEIRLDGIEYDEGAMKLVQAATGRQSLRIIANRPDTGRRDEYARKLEDATLSHHLPDDELVLFLEVRPGDASEFTNVLRVTGASVGEFRVLRCTSPAIPNAIAGLLLDLRDRCGCLPHAYFGWTEGNPMIYLLKFLAFGEGDTAPVCREVLRQAEPDPERRPRIHVG